MLEKVLRLAEENEQRAVWFTPGCGQNLICKNSAAAIRALVEEVRARRTLEAVEIWHEDHERVAAAVAALDALNDGLEV